ncbi:MAG: TonB-dependent receptor [Bacteroidota bacterium]
MPVRRFLLLLCCVCVAGGVAAQPTPPRIALSWSDPVPLRQALDELAEQAGIDLVYADRLVEGFVTDGGWAGDDSEVGLAALLAETGLRAERVRRGQYVLIALPPGTPEDEDPEALRGTLEGSVVDAETGETLPGAHVFLEDLGLGAITTATGDFAVPDLPTGEYRVRVSYVGYRTVALALSVFPESPALPTVIRLRPQPFEATSVVVETGLEPEAVPGASAVRPEEAALPSFLGEGDLFAVLSFLPGVERAAEAGGEMVVRGAESHYNRYLLDGVPLIHPWHTFGFFSAYQPEALKRVQLFKGSLPAQYGGALSSVLVAETKDGLGGRPRGVAALSPVALRAVAEVPLATNVGLTASARRSYLDLLLAPSLRPTGNVALTPTNAETEAATDFGYAFYDVHTKLSWRPSRWHRLAATVYTGGDRLNADVPLRDLIDDPGDLDTDASVGYRWGNLLLSGRYDYLYGRTFFVSTTAYHSAYRTREDALDEGDPLRAPLLDSAYRVRFAETGLRSDVDYFVSLAHQVRAGLEARYRIFDSDLREVVRRNSLVDRTARSNRVTAVEAVAYAEDRWQVNRRWQLRPGVRLGIYGPDGDVFLSPRFYARYAWEQRGFFVQAGLSRQVQTLHRLRERYAAGYDLAANRWLPAGGRVDPATGWQLAIGAGWRPVPRLSLALDAYTRHFDDILLPLTDAPRPDLSRRRIDAGVLVEDYVAGVQRSVGAELAVQVEQEAWDLGLSYALSRTEERPEGGRVWRAGRYDLPHSAQVLLQRQSERWSVAVTGTARSGFPVAERVEAGRTRLPTYLRLDLAASIRFPFAGLRWSTQAQVYNLTARRNIVDIRPDANGVQRSVVGLGLVPMLTLTARW